MSSEDGDTFDLREMVKEDYSELSREDPVEGSFRTVGRSPHNLANVVRLRERHPNEYARRMKSSAIKPEVPEGRHLDPGWHTSTLAGQVLKGLFDNDDVANVKKYFEEDKLGIPSEFIELDEVKDYIKTLAGRDWGSQQVAEYLLRSFNLPIPDERQHTRKRIKINLKMFR